jgi:hypothetical protein
MVKHKISAADTLYKSAKKLFKVGKYNSDSRHVPISGTVFPGAIAFQQSA